MRDLRVAVAAVLLLTFPIFGSSGEQRSATLLAGDGQVVTSPSSLDSVRFKNFRETLTIDDVERRWPDVDRENIVRQMGTGRHAKTVDFLYRVAIVDSALYKGKMPQGYTLGEFAISSLIRNGHPTVPDKLAAILRAPMEQVAPEERRTIKNSAARRLLRFKGMSRPLIYETLDVNAQAGTVACPFPPPASFRRKDGTWIDPPVEREGRDLMRKWLDSFSGIARLKAARCMAESGDTDPRLRSLAEDALKPAQEARTPSSDERFLADQILQALSVHGDKQAERARDQMEMEREIKRLSIPGHPEEDKRIRGKREEEIRKKWQK